MSVRVEKIHPALKYGAYSATALLPGEDPAAFEKLRQDLIAELRPDGPLQNETVADIARLTWRKQNLETFRIAEAARARYSAIISKIVPEDRFSVLDFGFPSADPEELETRRAEMGAYLSRWGKQ